MKTDLRTSKEWAAYFENEIQIIDPDGWDRDNFDFSFNQEKITFEEFEYRACRSTCLFPDTDSLI